MVELPHFDMGEVIPGVIHQVFISDAPLPVELVANIEEISRVNKGWEHRLYGRDDVAPIILKYYGPEVLKVYSRINPRYGAARADLFRYLLMYAEGGFYLDVKSATTRPIAALLTADDRLVLSQWPNEDGEKYAGWGIHPELESIKGGELQQWHIIAVSGHPFLRAVIERVIHNIEHYNIRAQGVGRDSVLRVTGPIAYTLAIDGIKDQHPHKVVNILEDFGVVYSIYEAPGRNRSHQDVFKTRHYAGLKSPLVKPSSIRDLCRMAIFYAGLTVFYLKKYVPIMMQRIFSGKQA